MIKLIVFLAFLLIIAVVIWGVTPDYEKCYSNMEYEGYASMNCCGGLTGGTKSTNYLSETCCSCLHYVDLGCDPIRKEENNEQRN